MRTLKRSKGITLIALVITIIVLLILAGISIATLTGENGILNKADTAKQKTEQGAAEEQVKLAVMASYDKNGKLEINELKKELEKIPGNVTITDTNGGFPITVTIDNKYTFIIDEKGNVEIGGPRPVVDKDSITVTLNDGGAVPSDGAEDGTPLKITFTASMEGGTITKVMPGTLQNGQITYTTTGTEKEVTFKITGTVGNNTYETSYTISLKEYYKKTEVEAGDIIKNPSSFYGATVTGYDCPNSAGVNAWKIFYADENNIYIIADDYIHYDYCPPSATQAITKNSDYTLSMNNVITDYPNGSAHITSEKIKTLNSDYFNIKGYTSSSNNIKATAYMLDTNVWRVYKGNKAEYAIGGPSIEMLMKSYSQKYNLDYKAQVSSSIGYQISKDGGSSWANYYTGTLNVNDNLYVISNTSKASAYWLASPSAGGDNELMFAGGNAYVGFGNYGGAGVGLRPIVCLNSNIQLEKKTDGTYAIK